MSPEGKKDYPGENRGKKEVDISGQRKEGSEVLRHELIWNEITWKTFKYGK